jgi:hypothetical protein
MNDFDLLTLETISSDELPEGGFIMDDSHILTYVPNYFEDELHDVPDEDNWDYDELLLDDDNTEREEF